MRRCKRLAEIFWLHIKDAGKVLVYACGGTKYTCLFFAPGQSRLVKVWLRRVAEIPDNMVRDKMATSTNERFHWIGGAKLFAFTSFLGTVTISTFVAHTIGIFSRGFEPTNLDYAR